MMRLRAELGSEEEMTANKSKFDLCSLALAEWGTDCWILHHTLQHLIHRINSIKSYNHIHKECTNHLKEMILVKHPALSLFFIKAKCGILLLPWEHESRSLFTAKVLFVNSTNFLERILQLAKIGTDNLQQQGRCPDQRKQLPFSTKKMIQLFYSLATTVCAYI